MPNFLFRPFPHPLPLINARALRRAKLRMPMAMLGATLCLNIVAQAQNPQTPEWAELMKAEQGVTRGLVSAGALSAREAEAAGALPMDETIRMLDDMNIHGMSKAERERVRWGLGEVLGRQLDELPPDQRPKLANSIRLSVADHYRSQGDERAIPIYEEMIAEFEAMEKKRRGSFKDGWIIPLAHLGMFYSEQNQPLKSAQAWSRWSEMETSDEWNADWRFMAARAYVAAGETETAKQLYAEVPQYGQDLFTGLTRYDQTNVLMREGKYMEARQLVNETLKKVDAPVARAIQLMLLSQVSYKLGDFAGAQTAAQSCLEEAGKAQNVSRAVGFDVVAPTAQELLRWSRIWQKTPLVCSPEALTRKVNTAQKSPWKTRITVRSFKTVPLSVKCDDARVKCIVIPIEDDPWFPRRETRFSEQTIEIEVRLATALQTELHISSAQLPEATCDIPLQISS